MPYIEHAKAGETDQEVEGCFGLGKPAASFPTGDSYWF